MNDPHLIRFEDGRLLVPDEPLVAAMPGDGIGPEVWAAARPVLDAAVERAYGGRRRIHWEELPLGQGALEAHGALLPPQTLEGIRRLRVALKGPTMTPVGGGHRSLNVTLRQTFDLWANVRPVRYFPGVESPMRHPERLDVVIFRENTEDVYAGVELAAGSEGARELARTLERLGQPVPMEAGLGIKVMTQAASERLVRAAVQFALDSGRPRVTLVHKGNIMKQTEGAFLRWGMALVRREFAGRAYVAGEAPTGDPTGQVVVDERIADAMFQALLLSPERFSVIAAPNLNGDYLSDACAAQVGGLGIAPGANLGSGIAVFESTHGTAPDIAGKGIANPGSMILSGAMLLRHLGWTEAATAVEQAFAATLASGRMTGDLAAGREGMQALGTSAFSAVLVEAVGATGEPPLAR